MSKGFDVDDNEIGFGFAPVLVGIISGLPFVGSFLGPILAELLNLATAFLNAFGCSLTDCD